MKRNLMIIGIIAALVAAFVVAYLLLTPEGELGMTGEMVSVDSDIPAVLGYAEGEEIFFMHTEASDADVAGMLTEMMGGSPVLIVPDLAEVPEDALATVYVFTNGVEGEGPLGFQPDVFDHPPGSDEYSPLRALYRVTWVDEGDAEVLGSAEEVLEAAAEGELEIEPTDVVVNMPFITWPGGER